MAKAREDVQTSNPPEAAVLLGNITTLEGALTTEEAVEANVSRLTPLHGEPLWDYGANRPAEGRNWAWDMLLTETCTIQIRNAMRALKGYHGLGLSLVPFRSADGAWTQYCVQYRAQQQAHQRQQGQWRNVAPQPRGTTRDAPEWGTDTMEEDDEEGYGGWHSWASEAPDRRRQRQRY